MAIFDYLPLRQPGTALKYVLILVVTIVLIYTIYFIYNKYLVPKLYPQYVENNEFTANKVVNDVRILMFTVDWCPYCKKAKPIWDEFVEEYTNKRINNYTLHFETINCTDENNENVKSMLSKYNIESYPTIKMEKNGTVYDFDAKPSSETLQQFVQSILN